ncbi:MAG: endonuclease/exonuclease/phosphatase family protein, partial [Chloroflexi bacterium]|nr:endonuclease/exonuclease/phosphatase family protein [Chloroflexota bacterium]
MKSLLNVLFHRGAPPLLWIYFTILFGWLSVYLLTGDRLPFLSLVNSLAVSLFFPLPFVFLSNLFLRRKEIWWGLVVGSLAFAGLWGNLFLPRFSTLPVPERTLTVMTYNVLARNRTPQPTIDVLRAMDADVVAIQELNRNLAAALVRQLSGLYPYQILDIRDHAGGNGVISKYPLSISGLELQPGWIGRPQLLILDWGGTPVHIVNFHMLPPDVFPPNDAAVNLRLHEEQARALVDFANSVDGPVILAGDGNTTSLNTVYKIIAASMQDSLAQAGFGFGHTFPGPVANG